MNTLPLWKTITYETRYELIRNTSTSENKYETVYELYEILFIFEWLHLKLIWIDTNCRESKTSIRNNEWNETRQLPNSKKHLDFLRNFVSFRVISIRNPDSISDLSGIGIGYRPSVEMLRICLRNHTK